MNNIRKIIEERLDNARNDWLLDKSDYLRGQMVSYRDCLNLMPAPRTEQEILNDFEILDNDNVILRLKKNKIYIEILKKEKSYQVYCDYQGKIRTAFLSMQEHKLLNELFECWGWL